ncbi:hypothetical protein TWF718_007657 [Orbilia javanica]|uniref:Uncharacterized protein n=1 Tax=Orbilia javanica TaxID=47235 RepID=A0AAN8MTU7_9PEZI
MSGKTRQKIPSSGDNISCPQDAEEDLIASAMTVYKENIVALFFPVILILLSQPSGFYPTASTILLPSAKRREY